MTKYSQTPSRLGPIDLPRVAPMILTPRSPVGGRVTMYVPEEQAVRKAESAQEVI